ncbi:hypothetical protein MG290_01735 [Flavobacterium sp. CBA20B-1]|uniref:hypothetical protein n=1 Tax=unclassified Flavobacterium TaxID=196869 RepID=UPI002224FD8D|nr:MULTISPECIES: hypothetical protein [unclassified Flavobacterium]WCM42416.1 hypothetical protein MG290_01735 [Flavobacterium sp. CBA20B-1]
MKKIHLLITILLIIATWSCKTKKSTTDFKETQTENVSVIDNSTVAKKETVEENQVISKTETTADKSFFEAWMQIKSDEATFEDKNGNKWTFKNPQVSQKSSQTNDIAKTEQTDNKSNKVAATEENTQTERKENAQTETKTDLQQKQSSKGREPFWLWIVGGCVIGGLGYFVLKRFGLV